MPFSMAMLVYWRVNTAQAVDLQKWHKIVLGVEKDLNIDGEKHRNVVVSGHIQGGQGLDSS